MLISESFVAGFTGKLKTFTTKSGYTFTLDNDAPHVIKGQPFVVQHDQTRNKIRLIPIHMPNPQIGMKR